MRWEARLESIRGNNTSGAGELAREAALTAWDWLEHAQPSSLATWTAEVTAFAEAVLRAQPSMAPLFNLANEIFLAVESVSTLPQAQDAVRAVVQTFLDHLVRSQEALVAAGVPLISPGAHILTFSYSSSVLAVLLAAQARQIPLQVWCTEGRPMLEGRRLAQRLAQAGVPVRFGVDAAVSTFASQASFALLGADSLTTRGVINKLGTTGVALACGMRRLPCYLVCGKQKWVPAASSAAAFLRLEAPGEVWENPVPGIKVWNGYFETTALDLFSGIVAEGGVLSPAEVLQQLTTMPLAAALLPRG